jgi:hypothetical protein
MHTRFQEKGCLRNNQFGGSGATEWKILQRRLLRRAFAASCLCAKNETLAALN